jgi:hypothetical protein
MKKSKSTAQKMIDVGQWTVIIAVVLGFMSVLVIGVWYAFNWLFETTLGISLLGLCARLGLEGQIALILAPFLVILGIWALFFHMPCIDPC